MWEFYIGIVLFTAVYGFTKLASSLQESDTDLEDYDKLQNTAVGMLKLFFSLLAVGTIWLGFALTPQIIEASVSQNNQTSIINTTSVSNINELTEFYAWSTSAAWITYIVVALIFLIAFFFINYTNIFNKIFFGKKRRKNE